MLSQAIEAFFDKAGPLSKVLALYQHRPQQTLLAQTIARHLLSETDQVLLAEAGTGLGKTMAYVVPALLSGKKVIISTGTKNLQEQLILKDIPLLQKVWKKKLAVEVQKGRTNYLCQLKAYDYFAQPTLFEDKEDPLLQHVIAWSHKTHTGDRAELQILADQHPLWPRLSTGAEQCLNRSCSHYKQCHVFESRRRAQSADLTIVNHHLYFADLALRQKFGVKTQSLLPPHDIVIFDEAHDIDVLCMQFFGVEFSEKQLHQLYEDVLWLQSHIKEGQAVVSLYQKVHLFMLQCFKEIQALLPTTQSRRCFEASDLHSHSTLWVTTFWELLEPLHAVLRTQKNEMADRIADRLLMCYVDMLFLWGQQELLTPGQRKLGLVDGISHLPAVRLLEKQAEGICLQLKLLDGSSVFQKYMTGVKQIFISATLTVSERFDYFKKKMGIAQCQTWICSDLFNYQKQAMIYIPDDLPSPEEPIFLEKASQRIFDLLQISQGGAFILCASHRSLLFIEAYLKDKISLPLFVQGHRPKTALLQDFQKNKQSVLIGTLSFWQGIDVPGWGLRLVIIEKIPFASPEDPWLQAKLEHMKNEGENPFRQYQLPAAAFLLRQGFGRLIRQEEDQGVVAILDKRLYSRQYGQKLRNNLPDCPIVRQQEEIADKFFALHRQQHG